MKLGIIGSGNVGGTLGKAWAAKGHEVTFGFRRSGDPRAADIVAEAGSTTRAGSIAEAAASDVVVLATPWEGAQEALAAAGDLSGKVVIDTTNPVSPDLSSLQLGNTTSAGEMVARWASGAKVVKAFNTVGSNVMGDPKFDAGKVVLFYCGDDAESKRTVGELVGELGFEAIDAGPLTQCRVLEPFALLWITLAVKQGFGRDIAFQFMRR